MQESQYPNRYMIQSIDQASKPVTEAENIPAHRGIISVFMPQTEPSYSAWRSSAQGDTKPELMLGGLSPNVRLTLLEENAARSLYWCLFHCRLKCHTYHRRQR
jgi:hypothetical protein